MKDFDRWQPIVYFLELSLHAMENSQDYARQHKLERDFTEAIAIVRRELKNARLQLEQALQREMTDSKSDNQIVERSVTQ
jgi:hypothetical protein